MASFGAKHPYFSRIKEEPAGKLPVYAAAPVRIGRLVKADVTVNLASGKLYADDALAESVDEFVSASIAMETDDMEDSVAIDEFVSASIAMETDDMEDSVAAEIYGATVTDKLVQYNTGDSPPAGGLGYIKKLMRNKKTVCKGYYYPLVKAALGNDTAQTKTDSITFGTNATAFTVFACENGDWRHTEEFQTEAEAVAWIKKQLSPPEDGGGEEGTS